MNHLQSYINILNQTVSAAVESVNNTVNTVIEEHIKNFTCRGHLTGLLLGNVQSGKTSQVLGIIAAAADEGFPVFLLLTTDNKHLQEQTYARSLEYLDTFNVCGEDDYTRFMAKGLRQPILIVIKKNTRILRTWKNNLSSSGFCKGHPLFIIDDEADTASLNTKINLQDQSAINRHLEDIKKLANSSIFLQVTATPQAVLLQTNYSGWKPEFVHYFPPGQGYLGGEFFYADKGSYAVKLTEESELDDLIDDGEYITEGLRYSLLSFLVASAHIMLTNGKVCNFLIHPSVSINDHETVAGKIGGFLNSMLYGDLKVEIIPQLKEAWNDLQKTKPDIKDFDVIRDFVLKSLENTDIKIQVMNSKSTYDVDYSEGLNIIVGGNSLGRGVTFPALQTVYYCRTSKRPQADTYWQHCRMFGYDRDPALMRVYLPPFLLKLFTELNNANLTLIGQIAKHGFDDITLLYPKRIRPTRPNVVEKNALNLVVGGVDMFASYPRKKFVRNLDAMLEKYDSNKKMHEVDLSFVISLLEKLESEQKTDWDNNVYINCIKAIHASNGSRKGVLIVRRDREIKRSPRTMLSPDDRALGGKINDLPVLTVYRINGQAKGWDIDSGPRWMPNIKLPEGKIFYRTHD